MIDIFFELFNALDGRWCHSTTNWSNDGRGITGFSISLGTVLHFLSGCLCHWDNDFLKAQLLERFGPRCRLLDVDAAGREKTLFTAGCVVRHREAWVEAEAIFQPTTLRFAGAYVGVAMITAIDVARLRFPAGSTHCSNDARGTSGRPGNSCCERVDVGEEPHRVKYDRILPVDLLGQVLVHCVVPGARGHFIKRSKQYIVELVEFLS